MSLNAQGLNEGADFGCEQGEDGDGEWLDEDDWAESERSRTEVRAVRLSWLEVDDDDLANLQDLPALEHLGLGDGTSTAAGLATVGGLAGLRSLELDLRARPELDGGALAALGSSRGGRAGGRRWSPA